MALAVILTEARVVVTAMAPLGGGNGNGSSRENDRDNRRDNSTATRAQVNSQILNGSNVIAQVNHLRLAKANEDRHLDNGANVSKICDAVSGIAEQLDNFVTASTMALHGEVYHDCSDRSALYDDIFYDVPEVPPAVMQVMTRRSTTLPSEGSDGDGPPGEGC